ncbi:hypothetical protein BB560_004233, partial [Smittium megazygosporum]
FEPKSGRVKGLSFHPKRPWILSSLHNGSIQLWDYRMGTLLDKFEEHEGPVRGIAFHPSQELFVSGGDDYKIRVWNLKSRKCLFTLEGHMDYVRTVFFHPEQPWIISASDDQTIRIWNWQSRQCLSVLSGHNHYVMSAMFHPTEDLVVSACLDQTVRVWDISGLRKKSSAGAPHISVANASNRPNSQDYLIQFDVAVKFVLEGHTRGVNWAAFHPSKPLIMSCGDDRQVKIWRMSDTRAWEVESLRGHYNNVSAALFHPQRDLLISCSEDKTVRVWETNKHTLIQTFKKENDRFWSLVMHPEQNLMAAGHDTGFIVFKLERERPAFDVHSNSLVYTRGSTVKLFDFNSSADVSLIDFKGSSGQYFVPPHSLSFNHAEKAVLISSPSDGGSYELHTLPREFTGQSAQQSIGQKGSGTCAVWMGRNRFAVLEPSGLQINIKDLQNNTIKSLKLPYCVKYIFQGPGSFLILATSSTCVLYDIQTRSFGKEITVSSVKYVSWSSDMSIVALISKHSITLATREFDSLCSINETIRIKSAVWSDNNVLIYSTLSHLKFLLKQGDSGIIRTLDSIVYLTGIHGKTVYFIDRASKPQFIEIDPTEFMFKLALLEKNYNDVVSIIRSSSLVGQSIISYIKQKGYPEVALHFVKDNYSRFELAIECGNMDVALETAKAIDQPVYWKKLAEEAQNLGFMSIVELAYQRSKSHDKLANFYLLNGLYDKLNKLSSLVDFKSNPSFKFNNSLLTCSVEERIKIFLESGQNSLAYLTAKSHGLEERAQMILEKEKNPPENISGLPLNPVLLAPPIPVVSVSENLDWPHLSVSKGIFDTKFASGVLSSSDNSGSIVNNIHGGSGLAMTLDVDEAQNIGDAWDEFESEPIALTKNTTSNNFEDPFAFETAGAQGKINANGFGSDDMLDEAEAEGGWGMDDDLELGSEIAAQATAAAAADYVPPEPGEAYIDMYIRSSNLSVDYVTSGQFENAMNLLNQQLSVVNFRPLKEVFLQIYTSTRSLLLASPNAPVLRPLIKTDDDESDVYGNSSPIIPPLRVITLSSLIQKLHRGYKLTTAGKLNDAILVFREIIHRIPFLVLNNKSKIEEANQMISICREYILGLSIERARRQLPMGSTGSPSASPVISGNISRDNAKSYQRQLELACYFSHCQLQPVHEQLSLRSAMTLAFKFKNYKTSGIFAKRLLDLAPSPKEAQKANQVITISEQHSENAIPIDYDPLNPFKLCGKTYTPIYSGNESASCAYCQTSYKLEFESKVCDICLISQIKKTSKTKNKGVSSFSVVFN